MKNFRKTDRGRIRDLEQRQNRTVGTISTTINTGGGVPTTRIIATTSPLHGGGDLSADRTLSVDAATTSAAGVVELATDGEAAANVAIQGNDSRLVSPLTTKGDLLTYSSAPNRMAVSATRDRSLIVDPDNSNGLRWSDKYWVYDKYRRECSIQIQDGGTGIVIQGWINGTAVTAGTFSGESDGGWMTYTTSTSLNNHVGHEMTVINGPLTRTQSLPAMYIRFKSGSASDIASTRYWLVCYDSGGGTIATTVNPIVSSFGFRYDTSVGGNWYCYLGTGAAGGGTDTGITVAADTEYRLAVVFNSTSSASFYVNDVLTNTITTNLPTSTTSLTWFFAVTNLTAGTARAGKFSKMVCTMD